MENIKKLCREKLLHLGFQESFRFEGNFYRQDEEYTAFFVNFKDRKDCLGICFGLASTAFTRMAGCENSLMDYGILNEMGCVRKFFFIRQEEDIPAFFENLGILTAEYGGISKDELLQLLKEKRKAFVNSIQEVLKPAGFKKKGNEWRLSLSKDHILRFCADKSPYCDCYNFDIDIYANNKLLENHCYCTSEILQPDMENSFDPYSSHRFDWQVNTREDLLKILETLLQEYVEPIKKAAWKNLVSESTFRSVATVTGGAARNAG